MHAAQHTHIEQAQYWCSMHIKVSQNTPVHQHIFTIKAVSIDWRTYPDMQQTYQSVSKHILASKNTLWCGIIHGITERITMPCGVGYVLWFLDAGFTVRMGWYSGAFCDAMVNYVMSTPGLWCHGVFCDVSMMSVMPWCILWCQYVVCDAMLYSVMSAWRLWCHDVFYDVCDAMVYSVMSSWHLWCHDVFCDVVCGAMMHSLMSGHVRWFCDVKTCSLMLCFILWQLRLEGDWRENPDKQILEWGGIRTGSSYLSDR